MLEQRSDAFKNTAAQSQVRVLQLEQEKVREREREREREELYYPLSSRFNLQPT